MLGRLFVALQYLLPKHALTALVYRLARLRHVPTKNALIRGFIRLFDVDMAEAQASVPDDYPTFNDFFIRELRDGARPIDRAPERIVSPVDGTVSVATSLSGDAIVQAKAIDYSLSDLFAIDLAEAHAFDGGDVATIYLAPYNYHRVHMPFDGVLKAMHYVPGDLFSVNEATAAMVPGLFRRNERLNLTFDTAHGPAALIFVGALNVGSISTPWTGEIRPRKRGVVEAHGREHLPVALERGELLGWFNMGSTVILLLPRGASRWQEHMKKGAILTMGSAIGDFGDSAATSGDEDTTHD